MLVERPENDKIKRIQTGVRVEKHLLKVLKGLAEHLDMSLGELVEGMALHAFEGKTPFSAKTMVKIEQLKQVYDCELSAINRHSLDKDAA